MRESSANRPLLNDPERCRARNHGFIHERILYFVIWILLSSNIILLYRTFSIECSREVTKFAGLSYNTPVTYQNWTDFQDPALRDQVWRNLDITPLEVTLSDREATDLGLDVSVFRFPWAAGRGIYFVKAFHDLHCLRAIKYALEHPGLDEHKHVFHCLDALRQDIMCNADDTPMPVHDLPNKIGDGQVRMCRDFDALVKWTQLPDKYPCYSRAADDNPKSAVEAYGFCSESSPYYEVQQAYFAKWGRGSG